MIGPAALAACALCASAPAPLAGLGRAAQAAAQRFAALLGAAPSEVAVGVAVSSPDAPEFARAAQTAFAAELSRAGFKAVIALAADPEGAEAEARARGLDWLARAAARIDGQEVVLAGDAVPTWVNFWAGKDPVRAKGGGPFAARALADAEALALARFSPGRPARSLEAGEAVRFALRAIARLPERAVGVAIGDLDGDSAPEIALQLPAAVVVLRGDGQLLTRREQASLGRAPRPPREPAGAIAFIAASPGAPRGRLASYSFALARGEQLELDGGELKAVQGLDAPALAAGAAGTLAGSSVPGRNLFAPEVQLSAGKKASLPFAPVAAVANPRGAGPAFLAIAPDGAAQLLSEELVPLAAALPPLGAGAALGDFDGSGAPQLVASARVRSEDRARLWRLDGRAAAPFFESETVPGGFAAGAAGDLDGDGRDEAVLAAWNPDGSTTVYVFGAAR